MTETPTLTAENDFSERKRIEAVLKEDRYAFSSLFDDHAAVKLVIDPDSGAIITANKAAAEFYGLSRETLATMNIQQINTLPLEEIHSNMADAVERKRFNFEFRHRLADGSIRDVEVFSSRIPILGHTYLHSIVHDITERKRAEAALMELEKKLLQTQKSKSLNRMAGAIVHHYNNLMSVVMGNLELALASIPTDSSGKQHISEAILASQRATDVSRLLLTYLGKSSAPNEPIDLSEACRQKLPILYAYLANDIEMKAELPIPGPVISFNRQQLQQILTNLVSNAKEALDRRTGNIILTVKSVRGEEITSRNRFPLDWEPGDCNYAVLQVADNAMGIEESNIGNLFDPFFTSKLTGRGLGLSVVLGIVQAHHGCITVESSVGQGSSFNIYLPVASEQVIQAVRPETMTAQTRLEGTVLLVEDEDMVRTMTCFMLTNLGLKVLEARDGIEALELYGQHAEHIRLVVSDLLMPRMDGWELLSQLRQLDAQLPVIIASGYDQSDFVNRKQTDQPQAFISKPFKLATLREAVQQALSQRMTSL